ASPDCPGWTYPAPALPGRRSTSDLCLSLAANPSVLFVSLPAPLQSVPAPFSFALRPSLPELLSLLPELLRCLAARPSFLTVLPFSAPSLLSSSRSSYRHRPRDRRQAFCRSGRHPSPTAAAAQPAGFPSWLLLSARALAKIGNPFDDVGVARNEAV